MAPSGGAAAIQPGFDSGSIVLAGEAGEALLVWPRKDGGARLQAGTYRLRTTRVEKIKDKQHWFLSSCGPEERAVTLKAGKNTIRVGDTVRFTGMVRGWQGNRLQLGFTIQGDDKRGLSVYREDKRVVVEFRVVDRKGAVIEQGRMNYG